MTSVVAARMKKHNDNEIIVDLFQGKIVRKFTDIKKAIEFARNHCIGLLKTDETSAVSIWYEREDNRASYLIFERMINEEGFEILEYEETAYDYILSHDPFFRGHMTRKMINERYYSFHDFARKSTLTSSFIAALRIGINIMAMIISIVFLLYGLHAVNMSSVSPLLSDKETVSLNIYIVTGSIITFMIGGLSLLSYSYPIYKLNKVNWNYDDIDWRKLSRLRRRLKTVVIITVLIGSGMAGHFMWIYLNSELWETWQSNGEALPFFVITIMTSGVFVLIGIMAASNMINNVMIRKGNIHKYFTPEEIEKYHDWINFKSNDVVYKSDKKYFLTDFDRSHDITLAKLAMIQEVIRTSTKEEIKDYKEKALARYRIAVSIYMKQLRSAETV